MLDDSRAESGLVRRVPKIYLTDGGPSVRRPTFPTVVGGFLHVGYVLRTVLERICCLQRSVRNWKIARAVGAMSGGPAEKLLLGFPDHPRPCVWMIWVFNTPARNCYLSRAFSYLPRAFHAADHR